MSGVARGRAYGCQKRSQTSVRCHSTPCLDLLTNINKHLPGQQCANDATIMMSNTTKV